jgi:phage shock protein A
MADTPNEPIEAEIVPDGAAPTVPADYTDRGVPTLDYVRDKIEGRYATSVGMEELTAQTQQGRSLEDQEAKRKEAADAKLEEIRRSMGR